MKRFFLIGVIFLTTYSSIMAVPALRRKVVHEQPDGTTITLQLCGDEHFHYFVDEKGKYVSKDNEGFYKVIPTKKFKQIQTKRLAAKKAPSRTTTLTRNLAPRVAVLLVQFADVKFNAENTKEAYNNMLNGSNYSYEKKISDGTITFTVKAEGSAKEYFRHQSNGKYVPQFDVVGPITMNENLEYYGGDNQKGDDKNVPLLVKDACLIAQKDFNVDFGLYDNDNDNKVDIVYVIYAGRSEADGGSEDCIWPHAWSVQENLGTYKVGKSKEVILDGYACSAELNFLNIRDGIGVLCHEFSHVLGLPDLYNTKDSENNKTLGSWDIMDYGSYNNYGNTPPNYSAYERWFMGWLKPTVLKGEKKVSLNDIDSRAAGLIFEEEDHNMDGLNPSPTTFYLVENRQKKNWDKHLEGHGLMITKVKFDAAMWSNNEVNDNPDDMRVDLMEADQNTNPKDTKETELFPAGATAFNPFSDYSITNIIEENGVITFDFKGGKEHLKLDIDDILAEDPNATIFDVMGNCISRKDVKMGVVYILRQNGQVQKFQIK